jgi:hypothetical protein
MQLQHAVGAVLSSKRPAPHMLQPSPHAAHKQCPWQLWYAQLALKTGAISVTTAERKYRTATAGMNRPDSDFRVMADEVVLMCLSYDGVLAVHDRSDLMWNGK